MLLSTSMFHLTPTLMLPTSTSFFIPLNLYWEKTYLRSEECIFNRCYWHIYLHQNSSFESNKQLLSWEKQRACGFRENIYFLICERNFFSTFALRILCILVLVNMLLAHTNKYFLFLRLSTSVLTLSRDPFCLQVAHFVRFLFSGTNKGTSRTQKFRF